MCRLLGWATRRPTTLLDLVGAEDLNTFTELSARHCDGWGVARATETGVKVHKRADAARGSRAYARWARGYASDLGMAHLRRATMGLSVGIENTHPFTDGQVAFAHNGSVLSPASLDGLVDRASPGCAAARPTASATSSRSSAACGRGPHRPTRSATPSTRSPAPCRSPASTASCSPRRS